jgi:hypothetical protein
MPASFSALFRITGFTLALSVFKFGYTPCTTQGWSNVTCLCSAWKILQDQDLTRTFPCNYISISLCFKGEFYESCCSPGRCFITREE